MFMFLRVIRGIVGLIFGLQVLGLIPVITWLSEPSAVTGAMMANLVLKLLAMLLFGAVFFGMRSLINRLHQRNHGTPHPALAEKRFAL